MGTSIFGSRKRKRASRSDDENDPDEKDDSPRKKLCLSLLAPSKAAQEKAKADYEKARAV